MPPVSGVADSPLPRRIVDAATITDGLTIEASCSTADDCRHGSGDSAALFDGGNETDNVALRIPDLACDSFAEGAVNLSIRNDVQAYMMCTESVNPMNGSRPRSISQILATYHVCEQALTNAASASPSSAFQRQRAADSVSVGRCVIKTCTS